MQLFPSFSKVSFLIIFLFLFCTNNAVAQIGINLAYQTSDAQDWEPLLVRADLDPELLDSGLKAGIDYWFRLKNYRVEFLPEVAFSRFEATTAWNGGGDLTLRNQIISFIAKTNFYIFDMEGDCDCPTFSKDGGGIQKGFFIQIFPGISYFDNSLSSDNLDISDSGTYFLLGVGGGIDIGFSDFFTLTPFLTYSRHFSAEWPGLNDLSPLDDVVDSSSDVNHFTAGLRIGIRWKK